MLRSSWANNNGRMRPSPSGIQKSPAGVLHRDKSDSLRINRLALKISSVLACCLSLIWPSRLAFQVEQYGLLLLTPRETRISDDGLALTAAAIPNTVIAAAAMTNRAVFTPTILPVSDPKRHIDLRVSPRIV